MRVTVYQDTIQTWEYEVSQELMEGYSYWCDAMGVSINEETSFREYIEEMCSPKLLYAETVDEWSEEDFGQAFEKSIEISNDFRRTETEVSGDNPETE